MGLDSFLYKHVYVGNTLTKDNNNKSITIGNQEYPTENLEYLLYEVGYWRKANQIHKWFVDNVQKGNDDCKEYYVSEEKIKELHDLCTQIISNPEKAEELLPSHPGFFFGSYEYDEYYMKDIKHTIEILEPLLNSDNSIYYSSSW